MIETKKVETKKDRKDFVNFLFKLYEGNKYWAPPFKTDEIAMMIEKDNPDAVDCDSEWYLAYKDGKMVGRIGAIINHKANKVWDEKNVRFTRFDFIDDLEVSAALLKKVEEYGKAGGMDKIVGPLGFSDLDQEAMLIEGFDQMSTFITLYNYPYYVEHMKQHGYIKEADWVEYLIDMPKTADRKIERIAQIIAKKMDLTLLEFTKRKDLVARAHEVFEVWNETYKVLYGVAPISKEQIDKVVKEFISFVNPDFIKLVVDKNNKVVGFGITFPSLTKASQKANGRLLPFGIFHMLRALKKNDTLEMYLIGVLEEYQGRGVNAMLIDSVFKTAQKYNITKVETNPELEQNIKVQSQWKTFDKVQHKRRRCFQKSLKSEI